MRRTSSPRIQFSYATLISLVVHGLLVLLLCEVYSEFRTARRRPLLVVSPDLKSRSVVLPELTVRLTETNPAVDTPTSWRRPDELTASMPRREQPPSDLPAMQRRLPSASREPIVSEFRPRPAMSASLPVQVVEAPVVPRGIVAAPAQLPALAPSVAPLPRSEMANETPWHPAALAPAMRIASLPVYGTQRRALSVPQDIPGSERVAKSALPRRPTPAFAHRQRLPRTDNERDIAVARGLAFLARIQLDDGRWRFDHLRGVVNMHEEPARMRADAAATGLALLAFLGAGHDHLDGPYAWVVDDGLKYLIRTQQSQGEFFPEEGAVAGHPTQFYSHGIATLALCEAFGMTGDDRLREPAQRALDYLAGTHRNVPDAWRILPGRDVDSASVSWQLAALRCGQFAGLRVDPRTMEAAKTFVAKSRDEDRSATATATAVGLAMKLHLGGSRDDARLRPAAETLLAHPPELADEPDPGAKTVESPAENPRRDTYYWYYGSEAMFSLGGDDWQNWSRQLYPQLINSQVPDGRFAGSWDASINQSTTMAGRLYVTAMNLLSLEIANRHLHIERAERPQIAERPEGATR